ncbi:MAG: TrmB family transcriptional regulator [Candidatus Saccharimonadales bacterium]
MTPQLLQDVGLNATQAKAYMALVESGSLTPAALAGKLKQQRTTIYMALQALEKLGLVEQTPNSNTKSYQATNPINLEKLSEKRRRDVIEAEAKVKQNLPMLLSYYYSFTERPGVRMVQGIDGLKEIYQDTIRAKQDIYLLRTMADAPSLTEDYLNKYRVRRAQLGITTYALTPESDIGRQHQTSGEDDKMLFHRTWLPAKSYTAPVEVDVYGSKTAFMMFGEEIMGVIVDSPQLAEAMRQVFGLLKQQLER